MNQVCLRVTNSRPVPTTFKLEPWGECYAMPQGASFEIVFQNVGDEALEVQHETDSITVYGTTCSVATVFYQGEEIAAGNAPRAPIPAIPTAASPLLNGVHLK